MAYYAIPFRLKRPEKASEKDAGIKDALDVLENTNANSYGCLPIQLSITDSKDYLIKEYEQVDLKTSVKQNIQLLMNTMPGSIRANPSFGSELNKYLFKLPTSRKGKMSFEDEIKENIQGNIEKLLETFEPRIKDFEIEVNIIVPNKETAQNQDTKRAIDKVHIAISIKGILINNEAFQHYENIPLI